MAQVSHHEELRFGPAPFRCGGRSGPLFWETGDGAGRVGNGPVSYTHLDVYKRQHYNSAGAAAETEATVAAIRAAGAEAVAFQADLTPAGAMEKLFADTIAAIGRPDIAINTVGKVLKLSLIHI